MGKIKILRSSTAMISAGILIALIIISLTSLGKYTIDIQLHDAYFVLHLAFICRIVAVFFLISALLYEICYSWLLTVKGNLIHYIHLAINLLCFVLFIWGAFSITGEPRKYYTFSQYETFNNFNFLTQLFGLYYMFCLIRKTILIVRER
jgi:hypothetical protein